MVTEVKPAEEVSGDIDLTPWHANALGHVRTDMIDVYTRMGYSAVQIAQEFMLDPKLMFYFMDISDREDLDTQEKFKRVIRVIQGEQTSIAHRRRTYLTAQQIDDALYEYIGREDMVYSKAWKTYSEAPDHDTKLRALQVAQSSAKNKAVALGVALGPATKTTTRKARLQLDTPVELMGLVNQVQQQIEASRSTLELEETVTTTGDPDNDYGD